MRLASGAAGIGILPALALVAVLGGVSVATAGDPSLRVRIAWGGGAERHWQGKIALSQGTLGTPEPLGLEADEPGSMWREAASLEVTLPRGRRAGGSDSIKSADGYIAIRPPSARVYDGLDLLVTAPLQASLLICLGGREEKSAPPWIEVPLSELVHGNLNLDLDDRGNRLVASRSPGDEFRVKLPARSLVFAPGEVLKCEVLPHLLPLEPGSRVRVTVQLLTARSNRELWSQDYTIVADQAEAIRLEVPLGMEEGAYDLVISAAHAGRFRLPPTVRPQWSLRSPVVERRIQLLVLNPRAPLPAAEGRLVAVEEIDPANPKWWAKYANLPQLAQFPRLQRLWKGPLGNGSSRAVQHALGRLVELAPSSKSGEASWEAYALPIHRPGEPHVLEVEYPSDVAQTFGISILEMNAAGAVLPVSLDSGVDHAHEMGAVKAPPQWLRHRLIFWPRTKTPVVLVTNRQTNAPAVFGTIRVLAGWRHLPRALGPESPVAGRLLAAYLDRPLVVDNFSGTETLSALSDLSVDDWVTFHEAGTRLVEYLHHVGYNALVLSVFAGGSTLYPSATLQPTPRYDMGRFFAAGQDPERKDVLEMLLRLFDREGLRLIPALDFSTPLPELEGVVRRGGPAADGVRWVGPDGLTWEQTHAPHRGRAPYYNVLHPRVQETMLSAIHEIVGAYGQHPSFAGLSLQLSADGYAQLPGPEWGLDDVTVNLFERDLKVRLPDEGPDRFPQCAVALTYAAADGRREWRREWLEWRAARVAEFYRRVQAELAAVRPGARLYLAGGEMLHPEELARQVRPSLPRRTSVIETLLQVGIDVRQFADGESVVLLRPERVVPANALAEQAVELELAQSPDWDRTFSGFALPGSLFFHAPQRLQVPSFDDKCPFKPCATDLATQPVPSAWQNRRRFVHSLATLDVQVLVDGGWLMSMGQEDALRDLIAVYRHLPAMRMEKVSDPANPAAGQPVTVRSASRDGRTFAYAANDAPFPTAFRVRVQAPPDCRLEPLPGSPPGTLRQDGQGAVWEVRLGPYDLVAVSFSSPGVRLSQPAATWPDEVAAGLKKTIGDLGARAAALRTPPVLDLLENSSFDQPAGSQGSIPGWSVRGPAVASTHRDAGAESIGGQFLHLRCQSATGGVVSAPFLVPGTGRLSISVRLRVDDAVRQPPLRVGLEGKLGEWTFVRFAPFGQVSAEDPSVPAVTTQWDAFVVHVDDLPLDAQTPLRVCFELTGPGEVWIDDVQLRHLAFFAKECAELLRLIAIPDAKLQDGQVADCMRLLEGYWPRFLAHYVPPAETPLVREEPAPPAAEPPRSAGLMERIKGFVPNRLRFSVLAIAIQGRASAWRACQTPRAGWLVAPGGLTARFGKVPGSRSQKGWLVSGPHGGL